MLFFVEYNSIEIAMPKQRERERERRGREGREGGRERETMHFYNVFTDHAFYDVRRSHRKLTIVSFL